MKLRTLDLFSGIGGFSLGLERTDGFETVAFCEIDPFCRKVLAKHWPDVPCFEDIKTLNKEGLDKIGRIDVICGGFPCQPVSCAGKRKGKEDARWLWPEFYRVVCEVRPRWVLIENVPGLLSADSGRLFGGILRNLSESRYNAEWGIVSAASVGAPHLRKRVFIVAHAISISSQRRGEAGYMACQSGEAEGQKDERQRGRDASDNRGSVVAHSDQIGRHGWAGMFWQGRRAEPENGGAISDTSEQRLEERKRIFSKRTPCSDASGSDWWSTEPDVGRVANGIPSRVDRLRALGNAIVPQCAQYVGERVLEAGV